MQSVLSDIVSTNDSLSRDLCAPARVVGVHRRVLNRQLVLAACLGGLTFSLYLTTMIRVHEGDALMYADLVRQGAMRDLLHPNHLLYDVIARLNFQVWRAAGWSGDPLLPSQVFNALTGAVGVALLGWILMRISKNPWIASASAAGLAMSFAYWYHSTEMAVHVLPVVLVLGAFAIALRYMEEPGLAAAGFVGLFTGLSVLFLQSNIFFVLVTGLAIFITNSDAVRRVRHGLLFVGTAALPVAIGYLVFPCVFLNICGPRPVLHWTMGYARLPWYGFHSNTWYNAAFGWGRTVFGGVSVPTSVSHSIVNMIGRGEYALQLVPFVLTLGLVLPVLLTIRRIWKTQTKITLVLLVWLTIFVIFGLWWEPANVKYWIPTLPPIFLLVGLACHQVWLIVRSNPIARPLFQVAVVATLIVLGATSYAGGIRPLLDTRNDPNLTLATELNPYLKDSDLVLAPKNYYSFPAYLKLNAGKQATTLHYLAEKFFVDPSLKNTTSYSSYIDAEYSNVQHRDGRVYVVNNGFEIPSWTIDRQLVSREEAGRVVARYSLQQIARFSDGNTLYELKSSTPAGN